MWKSLLMLVCLAGLFRGAPCWGADQPTSPKLSDDSKREVLQLLREADALAAQKQYDEAIKKYQKCLELDKNNTRAQHGLMKCYAAKGDRRSLVRTMDRLQEKRRQREAQNVSKQQLKSSQTTPVLPDDRPPLPRPPNEAPRPELAEQVNGVAIGDPPARAVEAWGEPKSRYTDTDYQRLIWDFGVGVCIDSKQDKIYEIFRSTGSRSNWKTPTKKGCHPAVTKADALKLYQDWGNPVCTKSPEMTGLVEAREICVWRNGTLRVELQFDAATGKLKVFMLRADTARQ